MHTEHNGITITYNEGMDCWEFTLRNRERVEPSLAKAKAAIDKPVREKEDSFERVPGWSVDYSGGHIEEAEATSEVNRRYGGLGIRVTSGGRSHVITKTDFIPITEANARKIAKLRKLQKLIDDAINKRRCLRESLEGLP